MQESESEKAKIGRMIKEDEEFHKSFEESDEQIKRLVNEYKLDLRERRKSFTVQYNKQFKQYQ